KDAAARAAGTRRRARTGAAPGGADWADTLPDDLAPPGPGLADALGFGVDAALAVAGRAVGRTDGRTARLPARARAGPPASARPLGTAVGTARAGFVLVASGRVVGAGAFARRGGRVLRRLGDVGIA